MRRTAWIPIAGLMLCLLLLARMSAVWTGDPWPDCDTAGGDRTGREVTDALTALSRLSLGPTVLDVLRVGGCGK